MNLFSSLFIISAVFRLTLAFAPSSKSVGWTSRSVGSLVQESSSSALDMASSSRRPFISGNWKLNPQSRAEAVTLANEIANAITPSSPDADIALFVPYVFIEAAMNSVNKKLQVGAEVSNKQQKVMYYDFYGI